MQITIHTIDDVQTYELAPPFIYHAILRRFEDATTVVLCPDSPDCFIVDPQNFWDGPTHVYYDESIGTFTFESWGGRQHFPLIGPIA